jgi:hypothetical protein
MRDVQLWRIIVAFPVTFAGIYALALWHGPLGFYDSGMYSVPPGAVPSLGSVFIFTLAVNAIWWVVLLLPFGMKRPAPA